MKALTIIIVSLLMTVSVQSQDFKKVFNALAAKDMTALSSLLDNEVDLCIEEGQNSMSKADAINKISKFLNQIEAKSCKIVHKGSKKKRRSTYRVGELKGHNVTYRVFLLKRGDKIKEIRFDKN